MSKMFGAREKDERRLKEQARKSEGEERGGNEMERGALMKAERMEGRR